jgi:hypothetical protein
MKKKIFYLACVTISLLVGGAGCWNEASINDNRNTADPKIMFKAIIVDPIPSYVEELKGYGELSQGHSIYLKFLAPQSFIDTQIRALHSYAKVACAERDVVANLIPYGITKDPRGYKAVMPYWDVEEVQKHKNVTCYVARGYKNKWTSEGESYFMIDVVENDTKTAEPYVSVYFHETGI